MNLYGYYRSSASYRIRIILNLKGLDWAYTAVLLNKGEQLSGEFLARNPSGLVPVLTDGELTLGQSIAIAEYLEERFPEPPLMPASADGRARVRELVTTIGCDVHPLQNLRVLNWLKSELGADEATVMAWIHRWIRGGFTALEKLVERYGSNERYCLGDAPTLADCWLIPQMYNARRFGLDLEPFPRLVAIDAHCCTLAAFADAAPENQPDAPA